MSLLHKLKSSFLAKNNVIKICFVGLDRAGKSSVVKWLVDEKFDETNNKRTVGMEVAKLEALGLQFIAWDIGGQRAFRETIWNSYLQGAKAIIYVIDASDVLRIEEASIELEKYIITNKYLQNIPILLLANKQDLPDALSYHDLEIYLKLSSYSRNNIKLFPISCKTGYNIRESFNWLSYQINNPGKESDYFSSPSLITVNY